VEPDEGYHVEGFKILADAWKRFGEYVQTEEQWAFAEDLAEARYPGYKAEVEERERVEREARWAEEETPF
jgi:hypothetical protein